MFSEFNPNEKRFVEGYEEAWRTVAPQIEMNKTQLRDLKKVLRLNFNKGINNLYNDCSDVFNRHPWQWQILDDFIDLFDAYGRFPRMLDWNAKSYYQVPDHPDIDTLLNWFTYSQLKTYCREHALSSRGKKAEIIARIKDNDNFIDDWSEQIVVKRQEKLEKKAEHDKHEKAKVLIHYIVMLYYGRLHFVNAQYKVEECNYVVLLDHVDDDGGIAEIWYASKYTAISETCFPPFFPGDRTCLSFKKKNKIDANDRVLSTPWKPVR